jgi:DNA polymerase I-like protein with 3'-5' exonuclease and polymerase domains
MPVTKPSDLLRAWHDGVRPRHPVAVDTETSGLYVDSGARVSTVSVGWLDQDSEWWGWLAETNEGRPERERGVQIHQEFSLDGIETYAWEQVDEKGRDRRPVVSFAWPFDQGVDGTGKAEDTGLASLWSDTENLPMEEYTALIQWLVLVGQGVGLTAHHAKFDAHMMNAGVRRWPGLWVKLMHLISWDTQNGADFMTSYRFGTTSLKPTAAGLWGVAETNEQQVIKSYLTKRKLPSGRWDLMPWEVIGRYADQDARLTARLRAWQETYGMEAAEKRLGSREVAQRLMDRRLETSRFLYRMERRGLPFSVAGARAEAEKLRQARAELVKQLPFRPPTLPMAKHYWFGDGVKQGVAGLGLPPLGTTDGGDPQLTEDLLQRMVDDQVVEGVERYPGAAAWQKIQKIDTALSRWYEGWAERAGADGRLRTSVRQNGTASGRFSVENIQLQAIPHDYRLGALGEARTPRQLIGAGVPEGWELWEVDLAQAELRVAALMAGCSRMLSLIHAGADLHGDTATELFQVRKGDPEWGRIRNVAKRGNFSLIFGIGWEKLQADIRKQTGVVLTDDQAQDLVSDWNALYPEYRQAIRQHENSVLSRMGEGFYGRGVGWIRLRNGEYRWFRPMEDAHKAFNQRVQPSLAQFGIDWWLESDAFLRDQLGQDEENGAGIVLTVHDSMVLLLPEGNEGAAMVDHVVELARTMWPTWFNGVPGDADAKRWNDKE